MRLGVGYPGSSRIAHARRDLDEIAAAGVGLVVIGATEEDVFDRPERLAANIAAARERGLEVLVGSWGVLGLFGGGGQSIALARDPSMRQRLSDGATVPAACPNHPETGAWLERWVEAAVAMRPDGIAWGNPRLWVPVRDRWGAAHGNAWSCSCDQCLSAWRYGRHDAPGGRMPETMTAEVRLFRQRSLLGLLEPATASVHQARLRNVITVAPAGGHDPEALAWDVLLAATPYADGLGTEPAREIDTGIADDVAFWGARIARATRARPIRTHLWLRLGRVRATRAGDLEDAVHEAARAGMDDLIVRTWPGDEPVSAGEATDGPAYLPASEAWRIVAEATLRTAAP
jgi:hypothetical protein